MVRLLTRLQQGERVLCCKGERPSVEIESNGGNLRQWRPIPDRSRARLFTA